MYTMKPLNPQSSYHSQILAIRLHLDNMATIKQLIHVCEEQLNEQEAKVKRAKQLISCMPKTSVEMLNITSGCVTVPKTSTLSTI